MREVPNMAWRMHGRATRIGPNDRVALAICDNCGFQYSITDLDWQWDYAGAALENQRLLVCRTCMDAVQPQKRIVVLPPDPVGIKDPRPEDLSEMGPQPPVQSVKTLLGF